MKKKIIALAATLLLLLSPALSGANVAYACDDPGSFEFHHNGITYIYFTCGGEVVHVHVVKK